MSRLIAFRKAGTLYYVGTDHLGSTIRVADASFNAVDGQRYKPFSGDRDAGTNLKTDHKYTSQVEDASIGLYWYGFRAYDPAIGRFVAPDTVVPNPGNPQNLNRYSYALNNPLRYSDPTGHDIFEEDPGEEPSAEPSTDVWLESQGDGDGSTPGGTSESAIGLSFEQVQDVGQDNDFSQFLSGVATALDVADLTVTTFASGLAVASLVAGPAAPPLVMAVASAVTGVADLAAFVATMASDVAAGRTGRAFTSNSAALWVGSDTVTSLSSLTAGWPATPLSLPADWLQVEYDRQRPSGKQPWSYRLAASW